MTSGWSESDSREFLELGELIVPQRRLQTAILCDLLPRDAARGGRVVDLGCGPGLLSRAILDRFPAAQVVAVDASDTMLEAARERAGEHVRRLRTRRCRLEDFPAAAVAGPLDAVVSSLAIHHLDAAGKRQLFRDVARLLRPGGVLAVADIVEPRSEAARRLAARLWDAEVEASCRERSDGPALLERFRSGGWNHFAQREPDPVDRPSPLDDQLAWLGDAGLVNADVVWMHAGHAIFAAFAPPAPT